MSNFDLSDKGIHKPAGHGVGASHSRRKPAAAGAGGPAPERFVLAPAAPHKPAVPGPVGAAAPVASAVDAVAPQPQRKPAVPASALARAPTMAEFTESARSAARIANVPFADVLAKASQESDFNVNAHSGSSSAAGPFQFVEQTWLDMVKRHGAAYGLGNEAAQIKMHNGHASVADPAVRKHILDLRKDVGLSSGMAARYLDESTHDLAHSLKRQPTSTESRMAYFLGPGGAAKLIRAAQHNPNGASDAVLPQAAAANRPLFYGSHGVLTNQEAVARITHFVNKRVTEFAAIGQEEQPVTSDRLVPRDPNVG